MENISKNISKNISNNATANNNSKKGYLANYLLSHLSKDEVESILKMQHNEIINLKEDGTVFFKYRLALDENGGLFEKRGWNRNC